MTPTKISRSGRCTLRLTNSRRSQVSSMLAAIDQTSKNVAHAGSPFQKTQMAAGSRDEHANLREAQNQKNDCKAR